MTDDSGAGWTETRLGYESALVSSCMSARLAFGLGPALAERSALAEERLGAFREAFGGTLTRLLWCRQVHGCRVLSASPSHWSEEMTACVGAADGLLAAGPGAALAIWTADCVPVLVVAPGIVAAVHAGWRGIAGGVIAALLRRLREEAGMDPGRLRAFLGPAVGPCHYSVGAEVVRELAATGVPHGLWLAGARVDLRALVAGQLARLGVAEDRIDLVGGCTACSPLLASFRRDGQRAGRQLAAVMLEAARS